MKIVGLTGGIGSGKTTIANAFHIYYGIPTYFADIAAKKLISCQEKIQQEIIDVFGENSFISGVYNREYIAKIVFSSAEKLQKLNQIVHPAVQEDFKKWVQEQSSPYVLKESAILFESGSYKDCDFIITVSASLKTRIERVVNRDGVDRDSVERRIKNQWTDIEREKYATFVIRNEQNSVFLQKIKDIHLKILKSIEFNSIN